MKKNNNDYSIDVVITWVDGNDLEWKKERDKYVSEEDKKNDSTGGEKRYNDNNLLIYLLRGIEKFTPWVNKVFFVTCGHLPSWLNIDNPKLRIIKHTDFIPEEYLPTFNANPILLNLHRIEGLSEHFIIMNDDMYFLSPLKREHFFKNNMPCDMGVLEPIAPYFPNDVFTSIITNNISLINSNYNKRRQVSSFLFKWFNIRYGIKNNIKNLSLLSYGFFPGIYEAHIPLGYLKSSFIKVWELFNDELVKCCHNKTRSRNDYSEYLVKYYQIATGNFMPLNRDKLGLYRNMGNKDLPEIIRLQKKKMVCINYYDKDRFSIVEEAFDSILPFKSLFEL